jgi:regulator of sirC expression with transglutaminase-like and TPR domain
MTDGSVRARFLQEIDRPSEEIDLAMGALLIAKEEYPQLPVARYLARLDELSEEVHDHLSGESAPLFVLSELLATLHVRRKFRGNRKAYYDPRNSFLNDVLDRGLGIPLTLGIVVLEVGWRLDLPVEGVSFPGHFLVRHRGEALSFLVDPFEHGPLRQEHEAQELLDRVYGGIVRLQERFLRVASKRDMLVRLLTNLKSLYVNVSDHPRALAAVERILAIRPTAYPEVRDRGMILARLGRADEALEQLEAYLDLAPRAPDLETIQELVAQLRTGRPRGD